MTATMTRNLTLGDIARTDVHDDASAQYGELVRSTTRIVGSRYRLAASSQRAIDGRLHAAVDGALDRDVVSVLAAGWSTSSSLRQAAMETAAQPGVQRTVALATQTVDYVLSPSVDILVDGARVATFAVVVTTGITVHDFAAGVARGAVVGFEFGRCDVAVTITSDQQIRLLSREVRLTSNAELRLSKPVVLVRA